MLAGEGGLVVLPGLEPVVGLEEGGGRLVARVRGLGREGELLALDVLDLVDAAVLTHKILLRVIAGNSVLEFVGNDADVGQAGIFDRNRERGVGEVGNLKFVVGNCRYHRRRALITNRFECVGLAQMLGQILLFKNDRCPVRDRSHPRHANFHRLCTVSSAGKAEHAHAGQREFQKAHDFSPSFAGLARLQPQASRCDAKIVGSPTDFGKPAAAGGNARHPVQQAALGACIKGNKFCNFSREWRRCGGGRLQLEKHQSDPRFGLQGQPGLHMTSRFAVKICTGWSF